MTVIAYQLDWDTVRLADGVVDLELLDHPAIAQVGFTSRRPPTIETPLLAKGRRDNLEVNDFPVNSRAWPIISNRAWRALVGDHRECARHYPLVVRDADSGVSIAEGRFSVVFVEEFVDAFDRERSRFEPDTFEPDEVGFIERLVLRTDVPLPPVFRLPECPESIFVTPAARERVERLGCVGFRWLPVDDV